MAEIKVYVVKIIKGRGPNNWYNDYIGSKFFVIKYKLGVIPKYRIIKNKDFKNYFIDVDDAEIM